MSYLVGYEAFDVNDIVRLYISLNYKRHWRIKVTGILNHLQFYVFLDSQFLVTFSFDKGIVDYFDLNAGTAS